MFHPKSPGVSLILFSYMLSEMKSVEKPYSPKYGHGGLDFDHTIHKNKTYIKHKLNLNLNTRTATVFQICPDYVQKALPSKISSYIGKLSEREREIVLLTDLAGQGKSQQDSFMIKNILREVEYKNLKTKLSNMIKW